MGRQRRVPGGALRDWRVLTGALPAQSGRVVVKLVSDFESPKPVSDLEEIQPVTAKRFRQGGRRGPLQVLSM